MLLDSSDPLARLVAIARNGASAETILEEAAAIIEEQTRPLRARLEFCYRIPWSLSGVSEPEALLRTAARTAVGGFADACTVHLAEQRGAEGLLAQPCVVAVDRRLPQERLIRRMLQENQPDPFAVRGPGFVARTGHPELIREVTDEHLQALATDAERYELLKKTGPKSYMCVPLCDGKPIGVMSFFSFRPELRYNHEDLTAVAWLAALCEGNASRTHYGNGGTAEVNATPANGNSWRAPEPARSRLTPRELEILELMNRGYNRKALARRLRISEHTYDTHTSRIRSKLQVETNLEALAAARTAGLVRDR